MKRLEGKVALLAGGGVIGAAVVRRLAEEGCDVMIGDYNIEKAEADAKAISADTGRRIEAFRYDQTDDSSIAALVDATVSRFGKIDFLHCNAADTGLVQRGEDGDVLETDLAVFDRSMAVNVRGHVSMTKQAMPHIVKSKGAVVYTTSGAATGGEPTRYCYAVSKAAINALMRHVASRFGPDGVRVNCVAPGFTIGDRPASSVSGGQAMIDYAVGLQRLSKVRGEPRWIAAMVAHLFSDDGAWITSQVMAVDGGARSGG